MLTLRILIASLLVMPLISVCGQLPKKNTPSVPESFPASGKAIDLTLDKNQPQLTYISKEKSIPPILIAHGSVDALVPFNQSDILALKLEKTEKTFEYYNLRGADHGSPEFWTKEMFDIVDAFVRRHIK